MELVIASGKGEKKKTVPLKLDAAATVQDLKKAYAKATKKDIHR